MTQKKPKEEKIILRALSFMEKHFNECNKNGNGIITQDELIDDYKKITGV